MPTPQERLAKEHIPVHHADHALAELIDADTKKLTSADEFKDKNLIVFFGYSSCKHICTPSMINLSRALENIENENGMTFGDDFEILMVSTDPQNDTPEKLLDWSQIQSHHDKIRYLTGDNDKLCATANNFGKAVTGDCDNPDRHAPVIYMLPKDDHTQAFGAFSLKYDDIMTTIKLTFPDTKKPVNHHHMHHNM